MLKKIERLRWVEKTFGADFVLPYFYCTNWSEIENAIKWFEDRKMGWGMRTDTRDGISQGYGCPFLFKGNLKEAHDIWQNNDKSLYYIVSENILEYFCNGVAILLDDEHIFVEFNAEEHDIPQRRMYDNPQNLRRIGVGPASYVMYNENIVRSFNPEEVTYYCFDRIYFPMIWYKIGEVTFSVRPNKQVIVW